MARPDLFSDDEKQWLADNYATKSWGEILSMIPKTKTQIISKAHVMGLSRQGILYAKFSEEEDNILRAYYRQYGARGVIDNFLPNRTYSSILTRANALGLHKRGDWTEEEDRIIISSYYEMPMSELAKLLPSRAKSAIHCRIKQLGLSGAPMYKYSNDDIAFVKDNYETMTDEELGNSIHRAPASIKELRRKNKLYRKDPNSPLTYRYIGDFVHHNDVEWKRASAEQCNYKCFITGESFDEIHHLYARNMIIEDVCKKYAIPNDWDINSATQCERDRFMQLYSEEASLHPLGICLKASIHRRFHSLYGYGNNTISQFREFVQDFYPEKLCALNELIS